MNRTPTFESWPTETVLAFISRINARDLDGLCALMTEDHVFIDYEGGRTEGRERMREAWRAYFDAYPEYKIHVDAWARGGPAGVAVVGRTTGSHVGPDAEANGVVVWLARVAGGLVAEWRIYAGERFGPK